MTLRLYNTLTRQKDDFRPIDAGNVRLYVCGPTVYDFAHIGNARPLIVFDVLFRLLRRAYGPDHVTYARNITDVDDKIIARAAEAHPDLPLNQAIRRVTESTEVQFKADAKALGCLEPTVEPRATEHIDDMKAMIETLIARGAAYVAEDHVLFAVASMADYGQLANRSRDDMIAGARVEVAPYKRDPMDFVLWKPSKAGEPAWPSPAGIATPGRPGWHLECSAMADRWLWQEARGGLSQAGCAHPHEFDIHGGGIDLCFPHHENEIAQSRSAFGTPSMAHVWMHNGFLQVEGEKMSKSLGNFVTVRELLTGWHGRKWAGDAIRLAMLQTHYRQPLDWTERGLAAAEATVTDLFFAAAPTSDLPPSARLVTALSDDLNTPAAIAELHARRKNIRHPGEGEAAEQLAADLALLGLSRERHDAWARARQDEVRQSAGNVDELIVARIAARKARDFAEADRIRDELDAMGIQLKDAKDPATGELVTTWEVKR